MARINGVDLPREKRVAVSYTHLDVYKRQHKTSTPSGAGKINLFRSLRMNKHKAKLEGLKRRQRRVRGKVCLLYTSRCV